MKGFRRFVAACCTFAFIFSFLPIATAQSDLAITQETATQRVKELFDTADYDVFNINYSEHRGRRVWQLHWSKSKEPYGYLSATVDAEGGNIVDLYIYRGYDPEIKPSLIPKLNEDQAKKLAEEFIKKLQPQEFLASKPDKKRVPDYRPLGQIRPVVEYDFYYTRLEKEIPVEGDGFEISIDANTGDILRYRFKWTKGPLPSAENIIPREKAENVFTAEEGLELLYNRYFDYRTQKDDVKLVYRVKNPRVLIDAFSGEIIYVSEGFDDAMSKEAAPAGAGDSGFTPVEQSEIDATKNCITKEAATAVVEKYFTIPTTYRLTNARLYEAYQAPRQKMWSMDWSTKDDEKYGSIYARVDALTSELISYHHYDEARYDKEFKQKYDRSAAQKKAEEFLKNIQPQRFASVKLADLRPTENPERVREHYFNYIRQVEGIPFDANGFSISIDAAGGDVISFTMRWQDLEFPAADGIISEETAEGKFLEEVGLKLAYVGVYNPKTGDTDYRLAYKLNASDSYVFDAFEFKPLDYSGKPIEKLKATTFTDIEGHWAQRDIELLVNLGVITSREEKFMPDENITPGYFVKLLVIAQGHGLGGDLPPIPRAEEGDEVEDLQKYFEAAKKLGWIKEGELSVEGATSRQQAAALLVRAQEYEKVAALGEIYKVPAADAASVKADYQGHVAITLGLGLMGKIGNDFKPNAPITNAEAATILVRLLTLDK